MQRTIRYRAGNVGRADKKVEWLKSSTRHDVRWCSAQPIAASAVTKRRQCFIQPKRFTLIPTETAGLP
jgi:hypothetical protein